MGDNDFPVAMANQPVGYFSHRSALDGLSYLEYKFLDILIPLFLCIMIAQFQNLSNLHIGF